MVLVKTLPAGDLCFSHDGTSVAFQSRGASPVHDYLRSLGVPYTASEWDYSPIPVLTFMNDYYHVATVFVITYLAMCYFGQKYMVSRKAYDLRKPLMYWNLFLALFSIIGTLRTVPDVIYTFSQIGLDTLVALPPVVFFAHGPTGYWMTLFVLSKFFELIDTVFIILRKKPLSFLHWYHHFTVLFYTWDTVCEHMSLGSLFLCINFTVHGAMYLYYFVSAYLQRPLSWGIFVTLAQISQMFIGVGLTVVGFFITVKYPLKQSWTVEEIYQPLEGHYVSRRSLLLGSLMYGTYLWLFAKYFFNRYILKHKK